MYYNPYFKPYKLGFIIDSKFTKKKTLSTNVCITAD